MIFVPVLIGQLFLGCHLLAGDGLGRALTRARVGVRTLTANRKALTMTQATIAAEIHEALDVHRDFTAKIAFNLEIFVDEFADLQQLGFKQLVDALVRLKAGAGANIERELRTNAVQIPKGNVKRFLIRNIYTCNTRHALSPVISFSRCQTFAREYFTKSETPNHRTVSLL
jgi:hypothetical protein